MNEAIVEKLHGTLSILRRERDEVHRAKELAMERLRLAKEETERMERTLQASKQKYDALMAQSTSNNNSSGGGSDGDGGGGGDGRKVNESVEIMQLKKEVERIGREAKFQHMEYVSKRDTLAKLKHHLKAEDTQRSKNIRIAQETLKKRRAKLANIQALARNHINTDGTCGGSASRGRTSDNDNDSGDSRISGGAGKSKNGTSGSGSAVETQIRKVLDEDQTHGHSMTLSNGSNSTAVLDIFAKLQRCLDKKVDECANDAGTIRRNADSVQRRIRGYEDYMAQNIGMSRTSGARNVAIYGSHMSALGQ